VEQQSTFSLYYIQYRRRLTPCGGVKSKEYVQSGLSRPHAMGVQCVEGPVELTAFACIVSLDEWQAVAAVSRCATKNVRRAHPCIDW
jgi:hypothetical protein